MKIGIVGPIGTENIARFISDDPARLPHGYGGGFGGASLLGTLIGELLARGHTVAAFTISSDLPISPCAEVVAQGNRFRIHYCPVRPHSFRPKFGKLGRAVDAYRFERAGLRHAMLAEGLDLVHAHWAYEFALAAIASGLPHVITCHDVPRNVLRYMPNAYRLVRYFMARRVMATARTLTAVSPYLRDAIAGSARVPINVIPNPLPPDVMKQRPSQRIVDPRHPRLAMVLNGWGPLKNPQSALIAFSLLRRRVPDAELSLFGYDYEPGASAQRWADARGVAAGVTFVGSLPHAQLMQALGRADVLVHPSLEETFGMAVAEAMALGVPVIGGSRSGAVPWVIGGGGLLADVTSPQAIYEVMLELLLEPAVYERCREAAVERSWGLCSVETVVNQYEQLYRGVVDKHRPIPEHELR